MVHSDLEELQTSHLSAIGDPEEPSKVTVLIQVLYDTFFFSLTTSSSVCADDLCCSFMYDV